MPGAGGRNGPLSRNHSLDHTVIERNRRARSEFLSGASPSPFIIDPAIVRAWQRCVRIGVEPERPVEFKAVHANERRAAVDANQALVEAAGDELDRLGRAMVPSGASVILADMSLVTIGVRGRAAAMSREMKVACREGVDLSEPSIGSNALTIAAIEQSPSIVLNNAHFCSMNAIFACAAAPIRSPVGTLLGVVDVTTCHQPLPAEAPFLVNASARAIENAIFACDAERLVVRFHPRADLLGTPMEAVIQCSPDGDIVGANEAALGLLGLRWPLRGAHFSRSFRLAFGDLLARAGRRESAELTLVSASGVPLHAQLAMPARAAVRALVAGTGEPAPAGAGVAPGPRAGVVPAAARGEADEAVETDGTDGTDEIVRLRDLQQRAITRAIDKHRGNLSQAARELGVSRGTLYRRLKALGEGG